MDYGGDVYGVALYNDVVYVHEHGSADSAVSHCDIQGLFLHFKVQYGAFYDVRGLISDVLFIGIVDGLADVVSGFIYHFWGRCYSDIYHDGVFFDVSHHL